MFRWGEEFREEELRNVYRNDVFYFSVIVLGRVFGLGVGGLKFLFVFFREGGW